MLPKILKDIQTLKSYYSRNKKKVLKFFSLAFLYFFLAMAIVGFRVLYPYQFLLSLPFVVLFVRYVASAVMLDKKKVVHSATFLTLKKFVLKYEKIIFIVALISIIFYILPRLLPNDANPFLNMKQEEIVAYVDQSIDVSTVLLDNLETTGNELLGSGLLEKKEFTSDELSELLSKWNHFLQVAKDSEDMTDVHRYFGKISYFSMPHEHAKSFTISYTLYLKKFELFGEIIKAIGNNTRVVKALNEYAPAFGAKNSYYDIRNRHVGHETLLRRNVGRAYVTFLEITVDDTNFGENYATLVREGKRSHRHLLGSVFTTAGIIALKSSNDIENGLFNSWFPVQKNVANAMGKIKVSSRKETHIALEQIAEMKPHLQPGDIFVERRNWHASNVGIPGFWPHAALYLGTKEEANTFFQELFPLYGHQTFDELVRVRHPLFYEQYRGVDASGHAYAVIEGQAPGIILQSLEKSAKADYLGVLRPRLEKKDIMEGVLRSLENYGKPYDYNFDFETRDEIVCSELVYDAYLTRRDKKGVSFKLSLTSGRNMVSPNDMVKKFYEERGTEHRELDFVYFIDGNETLKKAFVKDENAFAASWTRPKFSTFQE
ncbi:MAG: YiiX/YebB-like N1pC/P60 family cysteine hydrolase [Patescibacteria group bacterium]